MGEVGAESERNRSIEPDLTPAIYGFLCSRTEDETRDDLELSARFRMHTGVECISYLLSSGY